MNNPSVRPHGLPQSEDILTIEQLNHMAKQALEQRIGAVWVTGEISNLACPSSGHWYFSLKSERAQIRCALFRGSRRYIDFTPENGQQIIAYANVSVFEPRGDYQLIVSRMHLAGDGLLQLQFEQLKKKLHQQGLFDSKHKKPLPDLPQAIGIITSETGAAVRDIIQVLKRRFPLIPILLYPSQVQGKQATRSLCEAIKKANQQALCDVIILARGGGSLEDLWCFNEASLAQVIFNSHIPIISGIGHEIDTTIADLVCDERAATPSAAAERVSPDKQEWLKRLQTQQSTLHTLIKQVIQNQQDRLLVLQHRLKHPGEKIKESMQTLDQLEHRLIRAQQHLLHSQKSLVIGLMNQLDTLSPLNTLKRGYTLVFDDQQKIVSSAKAALTKNALNIRFSDDEIPVTVTK